MCSCKDVKLNLNTYLTLFLRQGGKLLIVYYVLFDPTQRHERTQSPRNRRGEGRNSKLCHISFPCMYIECGIVLNVGFPAFTVARTLNAGAKNVGLGVGVLFLLFEECHDPAEPGTYFRLENWCLAL